MTIISQLMSFGQVDYESTVTTGSVASAIGYTSEATGTYSFAFGDYSRAYQSKCFAGGNHSKAAAYSVALGNYCEATGSISVALGDASIAYGHKSYAIGVGTYTNVRMSTALGANNIIMTGSRSDWISTDPLFAIGNGETSSSRSNALTILKNGNTGIGTVSPQTTLDVNGHLYVSGGGVKILGSTHLTFAQSTAHGVINFGDDGSGNLYFRSLDSLGDINNYNDLMIITYDGNVGIGTNSPGNYKLAVDGSILAKSIDVEATWSDFVFEDDYNLLSLEDVRSFIAENKHLPDIPSAQEVEENGINVGEIQSKLLQKIEELTLYVLQVSDENVALKDRIDALENELNSSTHD